MVAQRKDAGARAAAREAARAKIAALRERLRQAIAAKKERMRDLTQTIRSERLALRDRLRAHRKRVLEQLRKAALAERGAARAQWLRRKIDAKAEATSEIARVRAELAAERAAHRAGRKIDRAHRSDAAAHERALREQSDDEVRALIPRTLRGFFDRVKRSIRGSTTETRAEAFLRYAEQHPDETYKAVEPRGEAHVHAARQELAEASKSEHAPRAGTPVRKKGQLPRAGMPGVLLSDLLRERDEIAAEKVAKKERRGRSAAANKPATKATPRETARYGVFWTDRTGQTGWALRGGDGSPAWTGSYDEAYYRARKLTATSFSKTDYDARLYPFEPQHRADAPRAARHISAARVRAPARASDDASRSWATARPAAKPRSRFPALANAGTRAHTSSQSRDVLRGE